MLGRTHDVLVALLFSTHHCVLYTMVLMGMLLMIEKLASDVRTAGSFTSAVFTTTKQRFGRQDLGPVWQTCRKPNGTH